MRRHCWVRAMVAGASFVLLAAVLGRPLWAEEAAPAEKSKAAQAAQTTSGPAAQEASAAPAKHQTKARKPRQPGGQLPPYFAGVVDEKQREQIYQIQKEFAPKIADLKAQLEALIAQRDQKIAEVLTEQQRAAIETKKAEAKKKRAADTPATPTPPKKQSAAAEKPAKTK